MLDWDPQGITGPKRPLPDQVTFSDPKEDALTSAANGPISQDFSKPTHSGAAHFRSSLCC